jgi:lactoylglutathione lyase
MIRIEDLFETHLQVSDLEQAVTFYRDRLALPLARIFPDRQVAFFWVGSPGGAMLGLWATGNGPQRMTLHTAFRVSTQAVLQAADALRNAGITPLDFDGNATSEPVVLAWMPAVAVYFLDPDGNLLEFLSMLDEEPRPDAGVVKWSDWLSRKTRDTW